MINRIIKEQIVRRLNDRKIILLLGPRQAGKTTLLYQLRDYLGNKVRWWNGDEPDHRIQLSNRTSSELKALIGDADYMVIDEAQRIENIGLTLKLIFDQIPVIKVIATGSSALELANQINEPLTGRKWEFRLFPFSYEELVSHFDRETEDRLLQHRMIYGYYPDIVNQSGDEKSLLKELAESYLYKDVLTWERIQKPDKMERLLRALAFQVGSEVSYNELGSICGIDNETVEKYIDLLEKAFIVFRLNSFSRNLRNELKKSRKIFFYDNGIRNAVIDRFAPLEMRDDLGALWENFLISGRVKYLASHRIHATSYFWRTHAQQEIDYIEEQDGNLVAYEMKWNANKKVKIPAAFVKSYPEAQTGIITPQNYSEFLLSE